MDSNEWHEPLIKKKSGIVPFLNSKKKKKKKLCKPERERRTSACLINIYKYLGTQLTTKLELIRELKHIEEKSNFIYFKLFPYLNDASADGI